jgi:hypothetical protein
VALKFEIHLAELRIPFVEGKPRLWFYDLGGSVMASVVKDILD